MGDRGKVTIRQIFKLLLCLCFSPAVRVIPAFEAYSAKQVGWLAPIAAFFPYLF